MWQLDWTRAAMVTELGNAIGLLLIGLLDHRTVRIVSFAKKLPPEKRKGEANAVLIEPVFPQGKGTTPSVSTTRCKKAAQNATPDPHDLYKTAPLIAGAKARGNSSHPALGSPYMRSYNPNARCDYHDRDVGHAIERC
ncbi:hypothetical protein CR513_43601, partial [Mucuna pruriens]